MKPSSPPMPCSSRLLARLTQMPWNAVYFVPLGYAVMVLFQQMMGSTKSLTGLLAILLGALAALRAGALVLRCCLPFPAALKENWAQQRLLGKRYDSYQWRKLFWVGVGMAVYVSIEHASVMERWIAVLATGAGALGHWFWWRRKKMDAFLVAVLKRAVI
jgi:hypothetical protein